MYLHILDISQYDITLFIICLIVMSQVGLYLCQILLYSRYSLNAFYWSAFFIFWWAHIIGHCISLIIVLLSSSRGVQSCLLLYLSHHFICFVLMNDNNYSRVYFFIFTIRFQNFTFIVLLNTIVIWFIYLWIMLLYIANRFNENKHKWITSPVWLITCLMMRASSYKKSSKLTPPSVHDFIQQIIVIYQQPSSTRALHVGPQHDCQQQRSVVWK